ncbi:MAG: hypothetical protein OXG42_08710 [Chloroflexi bacterium]|nr:hypothetical protein [Chloroflexota bacterium]
MRLTRMYQGEDGTSHFEDIELGLKAFDVGQFSRRLFPASMSFRVSQPGLFVDWHNATGKTMILVLQGLVETEVTNGESRRFGPGDICYAEDVDGPGHKTTDIEGPRLSLMIQLPDDFDVHRWARSFDD